MKDQALHYRLSVNGRYSRRLLTLFNNGWRQLKRWWQLAEQRRQLAMLDERALHDLGLSRADVIQESEKPFWDDPLAK